MTEILVTFNKIINHGRCSKAIYTWVSAQHLKIPKSFQVPSSNISKVKAFEILAEFLEKKKSWYVSYHFHCSALYWSKISLGMGNVFCLTSSNPGPSIVIGCEFDMDCDAGTECCEGGRG